MKPRTVTIAGSLVLHALLALIAIFYAGRPRQHQATSVAVMGEKKKEPPKPTPPPPPPPPRPKLATRSIAPIAAPAPVPSHEPARPSHSAAPAIGGTMSNEGPPTHGGGTGPAVGGGNPGPSATPTDAHAVVPKHPAAEAECTEQPSKAQVVSRPGEIEYTQQARADGIEGRLVLKIVVAEDGSVQQVIVVSSVDPALDAAAVATVKSWVFKPAMRCGKPMGGGTYVVAQRFELGD